MRNGTAVAVGALDVMTVQAVRGSVTGHWEESGCLSFQSWAHMLLVMSPELCYLPCSVVFVRGQPEKQNQEELYLYSGISARIWLTRQV